MHDTPTVLRADGREEAELSSVIFESGCLKEEVWDTRRNEESIATSRDESFNDSFGDILETLDVSLNRVFGEIALDGDIAAVGSSKKFVQKVKLEPGYS